MLHVDEEVATEVTYPTDGTIGNHTPGELQSRNEAVDISAHMIDAGFLRSLPNRKRFSRGTRLVALSQP